MRAMIIEKVGGPEVLKMAEVPTPEPAPGEVLIRVACAGVNPALVLRGSQGGHRGLELRLADDLALFEQHEPVIRGDPQDLLVGHRHGLQYFAAG